MLGDVAALRQQRVIIAVEVTGRRARCRAPDFSGILMLSFRAANNISRYLHDDDRHCRMHARRRELVMRMPIDGPDVDDDAL